jgi:tetratricopeptide (TPR) repeat protein
MDDLEEPILELRKLLATGQLDAALELSHLLCERDPKNSVVNYLAACARDAQGREEEAVQFYEEAIEIGLEGEDLRGALLGLGSTCRNVGRIHQSYRTLRRGLELFPDGTEFRAFLGLALYTAGKHKESVSLFLQLIAETTADPHLQRYQRALLHYASDPDAK